MGGIVRRVEKANTFAESLVNSINIIFETTLRIILKQEQKKIIKYKYYMNKLFTMKKSIFAIIVRLYATMFLTRKDTWRGHVISTGSLKIDDVTALVVAQHTERQTEIYKYYFMNKFMNKR